MPQTLISPPKAYSTEPSDVRSSCKEVKMSVSSPSSPSSSSPVSSCDLSCDSISYCGLPSPNPSPSKYSSSSSSSPTFRERLRSASRLIRKNLEQRPPSKEKVENEQHEERLEAKVKDTDGFKSFFREHFILCEL